MSELINLMCEGGGVMNRIIDKLSFNILNEESFLDGIYLTRFAVPSSNFNEKRLKYYDTNMGINQEMGFSIKSYLGEPPTLLNASPVTNFQFEVTGLDESLVDTINSISTREKIRDRIKAIYDNGGELKFAKTINTVFSGNMMMIDSRMEEIISDLLLHSFKTNEMDFLKIIEYLEQENPLGYPRSGFYEHKVKQFLCAKALGMDPSKEWNGIDEANGGYIVVKSDGEVVAFHLYNRNQFEQYLLDNTKLERGSTSRHDYASIYKEGSKLFINLNLQIRFKKR